MKGKKQFYIAIGVGSSLLIVGIILLLLGLSTVGGLLIFLGFVAFAFLGRYPYYRKTAEAGIEGEKAVTEALQELDDSYYLINDILLPRRGGNIDHILFSPKRIFCIETKNWYGDIRCNRDVWSKKGERRIYPVESVSKQARKNAAALGDLIRKRLNISVFVTPICVFTDPSARLKLTKPTLPVLRVSELNQYVRNAQPITHLAEKELLSIAESVLQSILVDDNSQRRGD